MDSVILVPSDFSKASSVALQHAIYLSDHSGAKIVLMNLCKDESLLGESKKQLENQAGLFGHKNQIECVVQIGEFTRIPEISKEVSAEVVFIGTHGAQGMQKYFGSNMLNIISNSDVPYIVVQEDTAAPKGYEKIVVPTSFHFESKQKAVAVGAVAEYFKSKIFFIYSSKDSHKEEKSLRNLKVMKNFLSDKVISSEEIKTSGNNFNQDVLEKSANIEADLIAIMNMQKDDLLGNGILGKNYEQELLTNSLNIPVLIVSPSNTRLFGSTRNTLNF